MGIKGDRKLPKRRCDLISVDLIGTCSKQGGLRYRYDDDIAHVMGWILAAFGNTAFASVNTPGEASLWAGDLLNLVFEVHRAVRALTAMCSCLTVEWKTSVPVNPQHMIESRVLMRAVKHGNWGYSHVVQKDSRMVFILVISGFISPCIFDILLHTIPVCSSCFSSFVVSTDFKMA